MSHPSLSAELMEKDRKKVVPKSYLPLSVEWSKCSCNKSCQFFISSGSHDWHQNRAQTQTMSNMGENRTNAWRRKIKKCCTKKHTCCSSNYTTHCLVKKELLKYTSQPVRLRLCLKHRKQISGYKLFSRFTVVMDLLLYLSCETM